MSETTKESDAVSVWMQQLQAFSEAVGRPAEEVAQALRGVVGEPSAQALEVLASESFSPFEDLREALSASGPRIPVGLLRKHLGLLRGAPVDAAAGAGEGSAFGPSTDLLPTVPDDESFVATLMTGAELRVGQVEVISAVKAALAARVGLYALPERLIQEMEAHTERMNEPCGESYYEMQRLVLRRNYGELLAVLNLDGHFVSQRRKDQFLARLDQHLWVALHEFQQQLVAWQESWTAGASNPGMLLATLAMTAADGKSPLPPGIIQLPDTGTVRDAALSMIEKVNKIFAGPGIPISRALAWDALRIKKILADSRLPAAIGVASLDQLLRKLEVNVSADYVRLERNLVRFTLAILELPKIATGQSEYPYMAAMLQLGLAIPWAELQGAKPGGAATAGHRRF